MTLPGRRHSVEGTVVGAPVGESSDHTISGHHQIVHGRFDVRKRREKGRPPGAVGFTPVVHVRVVVDVVDGDEAIDGIGIVVVQTLQVTRRQRASIHFGVCHGDAPFDCWKHAPTFAGDVRWSIESRRNVSGRHMDDAIAR